ncbi:GNAT family N-acetyltransferase [uncultured Actinomyces sp.]|uniref:GNAT family N-acetyltransferase n=1 Tax=uncultured Actinomyces sp. TaxID=249061 RepID=UPI00262CD5B8|nr:GNAT family N-acetyltransferase [uncultured Actinomyces sp.]
MSTHQGQGAAAAHGTEPGPLRPVRRLRHPGASAAGGGRTARGGFVREARAEDLEAVGAVHAAAMTASLDAAHRTAHDVGVPEGVRAAVSAPVLTAGWRDAVCAPPSPAHHVLVATQDGEVVGLAALAPLPDVRQGGPTDAGRAGTPSSVDGVGLGPTGADGATAGPAGAGPVRAAELTALAVSPDHQRAGHGSRLLAAAVDLARADGAGVLLVWAVRGDESLTRLLAGAGLAPTGASRSLPVGRGVTEACWGASI